MKISVISGKVSGIMNNDQRIEKLEGWECRTRKGNAEQGATN